MSCTLRNFASRRGLSLLLALGSLHGHAAESASTAYFRIARDGPVWCFLDPEGKRFFSTGVCLVNPGGDTSPALGYAPYQRAVQRQFGRIALWAERVLERLEKWNFNTLGAWSDGECFSDRIPYTMNLGLSPGRWQKGDVPDFWSAPFRDHVREIIRQKVVPRVDDRWLIGYFFDNEMRWGPDWRGADDLFAIYLGFPAQAPGKAALIAWLRERYRGDAAAFSAAWDIPVRDFEELSGWTSLPVQRLTDLALADRQEFSGHVAKQFFATCHAEIRKVDKNHLILGTRFVSWVTARSVVAPISDYTDVVSVNHYEIEPAAKEILLMLGAMLGWMDPQNMLLRYYEKTGKPVLITEFSFRAEDSGHRNSLPPQGLFPVLKTQEERASRFAQYARSAFSQDHIIGYHWFCYMDQPVEGRFDGENSNSGLVSSDDVPWTALTDRMRAVNGEALKKRTGRALAGFPAE